MQERKKNTKKEQRHWSPSPTRLYPAQGFRKSSGAQEPRFWSIWKFKVFYHWSFRAKQGGIFSGFSEAASFSFLVLPFSGVWKVLFWALFLYSSEGELINPSPVAPITLCWLTEMFSAKSCLRCQGGGGEQNRPILCPHGAYIPLRWRQSASKMVSAKGQHQVEKSNVRKGGQGGGWDASLERMTTSHLFSPEISPKVQTQASNLPSGGLRLEVPQAQKSSWLPSFLLQWNRLPRLLSQTSDGILNSKQLLNSPMPPCPGPGTVLSFLGCCIHLTTRNLASLLIPSQSRFIYCVWNDLARRSIWSCCSCSKLFSRSLVPSDRGPRLTETLRNWHWLIMPTF